MHYQLPNGTTIRIDVARYLDMTDEEFERVTLFKTGSEINDPFHDSVLNDKHVRVIEEDDIFTEEDLPLDEFDLPDDITEISD